MGDVGKYEPEIVADCDPPSGPVPQMLECDEGRFVLHSDYATLHAENERLKGEVERLRDEIAELCSSMDS